MHGWLVDVVLTTFAVSEGAPVITMQIKTLPPRQVAATLLTRPDTTALLVLPDAPRLLLGRRTPAPTGTFTCFMESDRLLAAGSEV